MAIDCALCFRDESGSYFKYAYVTLLSLFENTKEEINVHILHDSTIEHGKKHLEELCASYGHQINFHQVPYFDADAARKITSRFNIGTTYRYYVHEFVKADKAIYMDCDVIVNRDIRDLYDLPLGDRLFASTLDLGPYWENGKPAKQYRQVIEYLGLKSETYISPGVLLMNLARLRELSGPENIFVKKTLEAVRDGVHLPYLDMDIMNGLAASIPDSVLVVDTRFNLWMHSLHLGIDELKDTIFHYVSKPYRAFFPAHLLYWKYYSMTPFAGDMFELMDAAYHTRSMEIVKYYLINTRHRRHALELLKYGFLKMLVRAIARKLGLLKS